MWIIKPDDNSGLMLNVENKRGKIATIAGCVVVLVMISIAVEILIIIILKSCI